MRARKIHSVIRVLKRCGESKCVEAAAAVAAADVVFVVHHIATTPLPPSAAGGCRSCGVHERLQALRPQAALLVEIDYFESVGYSRAHVANPADT